jgi:hypothetical protein
MAKQILWNEASTYAHLFDEAAHADESRAAMEAAFGNAAVTRGAETTETAREAEVVNIASMQGKRWRR